ncbi:MAG: PIG-L domain-containing protein [Nitrososphaeria archaeon]|nr:PIG-L domain-containing protein [Nitrososphaeria archaeon]NIN53023.1 PIG-L domain-containing protein [Nitrososphaeria archaeon]NIQ33582.1 PIG-L domain-containing protein [Nitrososphaeria archaeon]
MEKACILGFGAHVADVVQRSGGAIANHVMNGGEARMVCLTFGERGESPVLWREEEMTIERVKKTREAETREAAETLGINVIFLDYDDNPLFVDKERILKIAEIIREFRPDIILTHFTTDYVNPDHEVTSKSVLSACHYARIPGADIKYEPHLTKDIYFFEPTWGTCDFVDFKPNLYIDISEVVEVKQKALTSYKAQNGDIMANYYTLLARWRGAQAGVKYGEGFVRVPYYYGVSGMPRPHASKLFPAPLVSGRTREETLEAMKEIFAI